MNLRLRPVPLAILAVMVLVLASAFLAKVAPLWWLERVSLVAGLILLLLPVAAVFALPSMLRALLVMDDDRQMGFGLLATTSAALVVGHLVVGALGDRWSWLQQHQLGAVAWVSLILALPSLVLLIRETRHEHAYGGPQAVTGTLVGLAGSALLLLAVLGLRVVLPGSYWPKGLQHLILTVIVAVYAAGIWSFRPGQPCRLPAWAYLMLLIAVLVLASDILVGHVLGAVPLMLVVVPVGFAVYSLWRVDHIFNLKPEPAGFSLQDSAGRINQPVADDLMVKALGQRLTRFQSPGGRRLVVVCASGGGIQAAAWMGQVLAGLQQDRGAAFTQAIGLVSSVSGGSVGSMFYLEQFGDQGHPDSADLPRLVANSATSSLDATVWGLAGPDAWRLLGLPFLVPMASRCGWVEPHADRGTAIERSWKTVMKRPEARLAYWRRLVLDGRLPLPIFNTTVVEDGRRFLISPLPWPRRSLGSNPVERARREQHSDLVLDFCNCFPGQDLDLTTAARLSATFPYVSPVARRGDGRPGPTFHVADGGYFDNQGAFTALEWLHDLILPQAQSLGLERVLFLQINAFPPPAQTRPVGTDQGWVMATLGPLLALDHVRTSTQQIRNQEEISYLVDLARPQGVIIEPATINFPTMPGYDPPLSWKLTPGQKQTIQEAWQAVLKGNPEEVDELTRASMELIRAGW